MADSSTPDVTIRPARQDEQTLIREMVHGAGLDRTSLHWQNFLVAEHGGEVVGIGQVRPAAPELGSLVTREDWRGRGVGRRMIEALLAREPGDVYLECNAVMVPYYLQFGFERISWRQAPMPLKLKSMLGSLLGRLFGFDLAVMVHRAGGARQPPPGAG